MTLEQLQAESEKEIATKIRAYMVDVIPVGYQVKQEEVYTAIDMIEKKFLFLYNTQLAKAYEMGRQSVFSDSGADDMCQYWYQKGKNKAYMECMALVERQKLKEPQEGEFVYDEEPYIGQNDVLDNAIQAIRNLIK